MSKFVSLRRSVIRTGRRMTDPVVATHSIPSWIFMVFGVLLILDFAMAGMLIRVKTSDAKEAPVSYASIESLEARLEKNPNDPRILQQLAFEYRKAAMYDDALRVNREIADMDPSNTAARYHIGSILMSMGEGKQAEAALWDVLEIDPTHAMAAQELAELYASRGQFKSLLVAVEPAAIEHPEVATLQYLWGVGKENTGDLSGARRAYWLAMERDPNLAEARAAFERMKADD